MAVEFVGGPEQAEFMARVRGVEPGQVLLVPVDVGKSEAMAMVTDLRGEIVTPPFKFALTVSGVAALRARTAAAVEERAAVFCRVGVETAGHYHRTLVTSLVGGSVEVIELNPAAVKHARAQQLRSRQKTDERDLAAMADLMARGAGRPPQSRAEVLAAQLAWVGHRRRKVDIYRRMRQQIHAQIDLVFPGLSGCFSSLFETRAGRLILSELCCPDRVVRLGPTRLARFAANRGVRMTRDKANQVVGAARDSLALPTPERAVLAEILAADVALFERVEADMVRAEAELARLLPDTPAAVLTSLPGVSTIRASAYGAALGDPHRFRNADAAYAFAGLSPASYDSAGKVRPGLGITKAGSINLRAAILELGLGLGQFEESFIDYRAQLIARGKPRQVAAVAVAHRAHRLAFAMLRDGQPFNPTQSADRSVMTTRSSPTT